MQHQEATIRRSQRQVRLKLLLVEQTATRRRLQGPSPMSTVQVALPERLRHVTAEHTLVVALFLKAQLLLFTQGAHSWQQPCSLSISCTVLKLRSFLLQASTCG